MYLERTTVERAGAVEQRHTRKFHTGNNNGFLSRCVFTATRGHLHGYPAIATRGYFTTATASQHTLTTQRNSLWVTAGWKRASLRKMVLMG